MNQQKELKHSIYEASEKLKCSQRDILQLGSLGKIDILLHYMGALEYHYRIEIDAKADHKDEGFLNNSEKIVIEYPDTHYFPISEKDIERLTAENSADEKYNNSVQIFTMKPNEQKLENKIEQIFILNEYKDWTEQERESWDVADSETRVESYKGIQVSCKQLFLDDKNYSKLPHHLYDLKSKEPENRSNSHIYIDTNNTPLEFRVTLEAWKALYAKEGVEEPKKKEEIEKWIKKHYELSDNARKRISTTINKDKRNGKKK